MGYVPELWITNWRWTGSNIPTPQAKVDVTVNWVDDAGVAQTWSGTVTFPNDLQLVPVAWAKEAMEDLMVRALYKRLNISDEYGTS